MSYYDTKPLCKVYWKFLHHAKYLRHLQNDTVEAIDNIGRSGNLTEEYLSDLRFRVSEIEELNKVLHRPVCIIIMGHDIYGKLSLATLLLEKQVIPMSHLQRSTAVYMQFFKPVRFSCLSNCNSKKYSEKYSNTLPTWISDIRSFESLSLEDIIYQDNEVLNGEASAIVIEVAVSHPLVKDGLQIAITPTYVNNCTNLVQNFLDCLMPTTFPVILYAITKSSFKDQEIADLKHLKELYPDCAVLFIEVPPLPTSFSSDLPESEQHDVLCCLGLLRRHTQHTKQPDSRDQSRRGSNASYTRGSYHCISEKLMYTLCDKLGFLQPEIPPHSLPQRIIDGELQIYSDYMDDIHARHKIKNFFYLVLHGQLVKASSLLQKRHSYCMRMIILYAFDVAREIQITPKRINYAKEKEAELYENLAAIASIKHDEIREVIMESLSEMKENVSAIISGHNFGADEIENPLEVSTREIRFCTSEIQDLIMSKLNQLVGRQLATRFNVMRESYLGTLQRCLENLERDCRACGESPHIGDALKQMLHAAYQVEVTTTSSFLRSFWEKMKLLVITMHGKASPIIDSEWKEKMALEILTSLSESKLAKNICLQFRERIKASHEDFVASLKQLESQLVGKLEQKEENHLRIKKVDAPRLAKLSLESTSLRDRILYGMPQLEREIGRGQYGVVFGCKTWGGLHPCAIKSLVPLDDKHWNDLAMEFHYTRSVPEHDNIVTLRGSVIDYSYAQGETPAVLLIMDRLNRDLYSGLKAGLHWHVRLQISLDVTRGIRFLHSQGLVHRDIKLKNVLLDPNCRAKLTDLGFCKPEAMMSGSIVGTPIHMAPELFTGHYDNSVDVYAFGILFWYICSGQVKLPYVFEQCPSKDHLWNCVKKGGRPERLPTFTDECWILMNECWAADPSDRPYLGNVEPQLERIMENISPSDTGCDPRLKGFEKKQDCCNLEISLSLKE